MALSKNEQMTKEICLLQNHLETYRPGEESKVHELIEIQFPGHLNIGLFGKTGCGKTSLMNSLKYTVSGSNHTGKWFPVSSHDKAGGHTRMRVIAHLKGNISVIDNRGLGDLTKEATLEEIEAQMDGKRGYSTEVKWGKPRRAADRDNIIEVENRRKYSIGCAVFVFSARDCTFMTDDGLHKAVHFLQAKQGRYPVAVITNVDCKETDRVEKLKSKLQLTGISEIFEVANITKDKKDLEISYQFNLLCLLERCMADCDAAVLFKHHRQKEQTAKKAAEKKEAYKTKVAVIAGVGTIGTTAGTGGAIGLVVGGPIGSIIGAGLGAIGGGASYLLGRFFWWALCITTNNNKS